ncbi:MAG: methionine--tRNA ligase [Candidatus Heimdallarchaeaceae archaeon]
MNKRSKEKYVVTCAWPYVNTIPHLGTFLHLLSGDVITRYLKIKGDEAIYVSGSDTHGTPVIVAAEKEGIPPKELAFKYHNIILRLLKEWNIDFTNYTHTHNEVHIDFVQGFYKKVHKNGYFKLKESKQFFCNHCNRFLPDRFVEGTCPHCHHQGARGDQCVNPECGKILKPTELIDPYCATCKNPPILKKTEHWYFDLPKFENQLKDFIISTPHIPANAKPKMLDMIKEGLVARPFTRDLKWGIPAGPIFGDKFKDKVLYVWTEAVLGYLSAVKEWAIKENKPELFEYFWKDKKTKTVFCIGKDNNIFHIILFPALLMAVNDGYPLPYAISTTQFIMFREKAFSKSQGIGLWANEATAILPASYWRYYLIYTRPELKDSNFEWSEFAKIVNSNLNDTIGNFIHRTISFITRSFEGKIPARGKLTHDEKKLLSEVEESIQDYIKAMDNFKLKDAATIVSDIARKGNQYLSSAQPWHTIKENKETAGTTLNISAKITEILAILLWPIIPEVSEKVWKALGFQEEILEKGIFSIDIKNTLAGQKIEAIKPLFYKIKEDDIIKSLNDFRKSKQEQSKQKEKKKMDENRKKEENKIDYKTFQKVELKVATIIEAESIENSKKLIKLQVDLGTEKRQIVAGIKQYYKPEELVGRQIIVVANLKPAKLMGYESNGMLLAADIDGEPILLKPDKDVPDGTPIR